MEHLPTDATPFQYERIERLCHERGLSVTAMAKKAGLSSATMPNLKSGKVQELSIGTCKKIAHVLGVSPMEIYSIDLEKPEDQLDKELKKLGTSLREMLPTDEEREADEIKEALLRNSIRDLVRVCRTMYDDDVEKLIRIARILKE